LNENIMDIFVTYVRYNLALEHYREVFDGMDTLITKKVR
jgi:hypothetical protein